MNDPRHQIELEGREDGYALAQRQVQDILAKQQERARNRGDFDASYALLMASITISKGLRGGLMGDTDV